MSPAPKILLAIAIIFCVCLLLSGCISPQTNRSYQNISSPSPTTVPVVYQRPWLKIDPSSDFTTDANFTITGSSQLVVRGTTNYPAGSGLHLYLSDEDTNTRFLESGIRIAGNDSGPYSFTYTFDMRGNPPGRYMILVTDADNIFVASSRFNITSPVPYYRYIRFNPAETATIGRDAEVSGTTDLPAGTPIHVTAGILLHPCPFGAPADTDGQRTLCGGSCRTGGSEQNVTVIAGTGTGNTWNATIPTSGWCPTEQYLVTAEAIGWTNARPVTLNIHTG